MCVIFAKRTLCFLQIKGVGLIQQCYQFQVLCWGIGLWPTYLTKQYGGYVLLNLQRSIYLHQNLSSVLLLFF